MPDVGEERMGGVEMPSRKDARLTIGLSIYRLPRSGLVVCRACLTLGGESPLHSLMEEKC